MSGVRKLAVGTLTATLCVASVIFFFSYPSPNGSLTFEPIRDVPHEQGHDQACAVQIEPFLRLVGDQVDLGRLRIGNDRIFLVRGFAPYEVAVFDMEGRFLRTVGREGEGPGEYQYITDTLPLPGGGLALFDVFNMRLTILDEHFEVRHTSPLPAVPRLGGAIHLPDGGFLLTGTMRDREAFGKPIVRIGEDGEVLRYFGRNETEKSGPLKGTMTPRVIAFHPDRGIISVKRFDYVIERWTLDGTPKERWVSEVEWLDWPPVTEGEGHARVGPPEDQFIAAGFDESGEHLWLVARTAPPEEEWRQAWADGTVVDGEKWIDTVIQVVDPGSGRELCSRRVDQLMMPEFPAPGIAYSYEEDQVGSPSLTLWRLSARPL